MSYFFLFKSFYIIFNIFSFSTPYLSSLKNQIGDKEKLGGKLSEEEKEKIGEILNEKIAWPEENSDADAEELKAQKKEMEDIIQPIIAKLY